MVSLLLPQSTRSRQGEQRNPEVELEVSQVNSACLWVFFTADLFVFVGGMFLEYLFFFFFFRQSFRKHKLLMTHVVSVSTYNTSDYRYKIH